VRADRPGRTADAIAFAGPGNNGGDAFAAFASLGGPSQRVVYALPAPNVSAGRRDAQRRAAAAGVVTRPFPLSNGEAIAALEGADVAIDALLGTGGRSALPGEFEPALAALAQTAAHVVAIDLPTGVDATTGAAGSRCRARAQHRLPRGREARALARTRALALRRTLRRGHRDRARDRRAYG
jgi:NAD(P)H-hydrate repair Nnr-like enzyme with NAD(P)H-hydrate epimerase domain